MRLSYAKFLQLLSAGRVKRVVVFGDLHTAIVEVPHPWHASLLGAPGTYPFVPGASGGPASGLVVNPDAPGDPSQWFAPELPEWDMEKYRFYVDLPGARRARGGSGVSAGRWTGRGLGCWECWLGLRGWRGV
jgi:cell division protease FtsH